MLLNPSGPWTFHCSLSIPTSPTQLHPTNHNRASLIQVRHTIKFVLRVQRGDASNGAGADQATAGMYDVVVEKPVNILSDIYDQEGTALPHYSPFFADASANTDAHISSESRSRTSKFDPSHLSSKIVSGTAPERSVHNVKPRSHRRSQVTSHDQAVFERNTQFERLISGQESEIGEGPPSYDSAANI